jgi:hypothetical protein
MDTYNKVLVASMAERSLTTPDEIALRTARAIARAKAKADEMKIARKRIVFIRKVV